MAEKASDDGRHQRRLGCGNGRRSDAEHLVQVQRRPANHRRRCEHADDQRELLIDRCRTDDVSGLEILRGVAGIGGGDADDGADADGHRAISVAGPAEKDEQETGEDQRRDGHSGNRVR